MAIVRSFEVRFNLSMHVETFDGKQVP